MEGAGVHVSACLVVPCFNEAQRLDPVKFAVLADHPGMSLVFVDDGSTDATPAVLADLAATSPSISVLTLQRNRGKGEAVRCGLLEASERDVDWVGYVDADLATPVQEIARLVNLAAARADV